MKWISRSICFNLVLSINAVLCAEELSQQQSRQLYCQNSEDQVDKTVKDPDADPVVEAEMVIEERMRELGKWSARLAQTDAMSIDALVQEAQQNRRKLRPEFLYVLSDRLFKLKHVEDSVYWFYTAQFQSQLFEEILDKTLCPPNGPEANGYAVVYRLLQQQIGTDLNEYVTDDFERYAPHLTKVLDEGRVIADFSNLFPDAHFIPQRQWSIANDEVRKRQTQSITRLKEVFQKNAGKPKSPGSLRRSPTPD